MEGEREKKFRDVGGRSQPPPFPFASSRSSLPTNHNALELLEISKQYTDAISSLFDDGIASLVS